MESEALVEFREYEALVAFNAYEELNELVAKDDDAA